MSWRNLRRQPLRTLLAALGVALGVVAIVAFSALVRGMWTATDRSIRAGSADLLVFQSGTASDLTSVLDEARTRELLKAHPGVADVAASLVHILRAEDRPFFLVFGLHRDEFSYRAMKLASGRPARSDDEVVLGEIAARVLGKTPGDRVALGGRSFTVAGVFRSDVVYFSGSAILSLSRLQEIAGRQGRATTFQVRARPGTDPRALARSIEAGHPDLLAVAGVDDYRRVDESLAIADGLLGAVRLTAIVLGSLIIMNTLWMAVSERTREIGILRALGWSRRGVLATIVFEAAGIAAIGFLVGSALGPALARLVAALPVTNRLLEPTFDAIPFVSALTAALVLSMLGAALPAWRAGRISPAEALRHER